MEDISVAAAPNTSYFTPAQNPPAGTALDPQPNGNAIPELFSPLQIRGLRLQNRILVRCLVLYIVVAAEGMRRSSHPWSPSLPAKMGRSLRTTKSTVSPCPKAWIWISLTGALVGSIATFGPGLSFIEGTSITPEGRGAPQDLGLWDDSQIEPMRELVEYVHSQNQKVGVQLNHIGRKGSTVALWLSAHAISTKAVGGWPDELVAPSAIPYTEGDPVPAELDEAGMERIKQAWVDAAVRAVKAGVDTIEIHGAHGYLLHEFCSPVTNKRTDKYGGSFDNRIRFPVEVVDAVRKIMPDDMPLFYR